MKSAILVTLLASTLGFGAAAVHADDTATQNGKGYEKHQNGKHGGKHSKRGGRHGGGKMMGRMIKKLELTDAQQAQVKSFKEAQNAQRDALRTQKKSIRDEMQALDETSADYESQVAVIADKKANIDRQSFIQRSAAQQQFESILTVEQRAKLKEMKENRKGKGKRGGKWDGKRGHQHGGQDTAA